MSEAPRALTVDEMREKMFQHFSMMSKYWAEVEGAHSTQYRLNGLVHSIFAFFEGRTIGAPSFDLVPNPDPSDKDFHKDRGEKWWAGEDVNDGFMASQWHKFQPPE
jgi:hypothetical protein